MKPLIIIGDGGHACVLIAIARQLGRELIGVTSLTKSRGDQLLDTTIIGNDEIITQYEPSRIELINGIGSANIPNLREQVFCKFKSLHYKFAILVDPSAIIANNVTIGEGAQISAGVLIQPGCKIGDNTIVNTGSIIDHDCTVGNHCHVAPGVTCSGNVSIGNTCHIGVGSTIIQGISLGTKVLVAAGAVVTKSIINGHKVKGVPAREFN